jgi:magnesium transporter
MRSTVCQSSDPPFKWIDVVGPTPQELHDLAVEFGFHPMAVDDCLDPWHLPKFERFGETNFVILRAYDVTSEAMASNVQELTRKIAIFYRTDLVVTIHRADLPLVKDLRDRFAAHQAGEKCSQSVLLGALINAAFDSYEQPLEAAEEAVDRFEEAVFQPERQSPELTAIYVLKRRVNLIKRLFWQTTAVVQRLIAAAGDRTTPLLQDLKENAESYYFYADQLMDEINALLGIHVALASHRTNEVMRVLTVFSAFFLPLTFIVGIYGMNFQHMPELTKRWGYPAVLLAMAVVCLVIWYWFRRRGWLTKERRRGVEIRGR